MPFEKDIYIANLKIDFLERCIKNLDSVLLQCRDKCEAKYMNEDCEHYIGLEEY